MSPLKGHCLRRDACRRGKSMKGFEKQCKL
jgi:hypothetical protein